MSDEMNDANATSQQPNAPILVFNDDAGNQINEISLAPGEQKKITVVLADHPEAITQNFLAQWSVYDSNHQLTDGITCVMDADSKKWLNPLSLSTTDESVGGMSGNDLNSARVNNGVWRCMGKNPNGQFWYPRDMYIPPVPVAEFVLMASSDWADKYATVELDNNVTKFVMTTETGTPAANGTTVKCNYSMKLTVNNAKADTVAPPTGSESGSTATPSTPTGSEGSDATTDNKKSNLISKVVVQLDNKIEPNKWCVAFLRFVYNTFRLEEDSSGLKIKVPGSTDVKQTYMLLPNLPPQKLEFSMKTGEYLDGPVNIKVGVKVPDVSPEMIREKGRMFGEMVYTSLKERRDGVVDIDSYLDASSGKIDLILGGKITEKISVLPESPSQLIAPSSQEIKVNDAARREAIRDGLRNTDVNPKTVLLNDTLFNEPKGTGATIYMKNGICYQLTNVNHPFSRKDIRVKGAGIGNIYPGAIVIADSHLTEGNPVPLNNVPRAKIEVYPDFYVENNKPEVIDVSSSGAVHNAIGQLLNKLFGSSKYKPAKNTKFNDTTYTSKYEMMLGMGVDSSFCGCDLKVNIGINNNEFSFVQDTSLNQDFFTIRLSDSYRSDLTKLFGPEVTWETIKKNCTINGKVQPLAIITSVTYGRSLHYLKEYSSKSFKFDGSQSFSGFGTDVSFTEMVKQSSKASKVQIISLGDGDAGGKLIQASGGLDLEEGTNAEAQAIRKVLAETAEFGPGNQGIPVSYTIELLSGPAAVAIDPQYDGNYVETTELQACPSNYIELQVKSGVNPIDLSPAFYHEHETLKLTFKWKTFRLSQDNKGNYIKKPGGEYTYSEKYVHMWSAYKRSTLQLKAGEYLDGYVRMDMDAGRPSDMTRYITDGLIDASSGVIKLIIDGGVFEKPQAYIHEDSPTKLLGHVGEK